MCVACDIPAARKVCGFKSHNANKGCSKCCKLFPGGFGSKDYGGFNRPSWEPRDLKEHKDTCLKLKACRTLSDLQAIETATVFSLSYFDPIRFTVVDPMHNLFMGTSKTVMKKIWLKRGLITNNDFALLQSRVDSMIVPGDLGRIYPVKFYHRMFALRDLLPQNDYACWQKFVLSCYFLCRRVIKKSDLMKADLLLIKFCEKIEEW